MLTPKEETEVIMALSFSLSLLCNNISLVTLVRLTCKNNSRLLCAWLAEKML